MESAVVIETTSPAAGSFYGESGSSPPAAPVDRAVPCVSVSSIPEPATCRRGHNRLEVGRNSRGECRACRRAQLRRYRAGNGRAIRLAERARYRKTEACKAARKRQKQAASARRKAAAAARIGAL